MEKFSFLSVVTGIRCRSDPAATDNRRQMHIRITAFTASSNCVQYVCPPIVYLMCSLPLIIHFVWHLLHGSYCMLQNLYCTHSVCILKQGPARHFAYTAVSRYKPIIKDVIYPQSIDCSECGLTRPGFAWQAVSQIIAF